MTPNQQFYVGHFYPDSIISLGQLTHEKVFICAGKYRVKGALNLTGIRKRG